MSDLCDILIIGTGSLAESLIDGLSLAQSGPLHVVIGGRDLARLRWLQISANARAASFGQETFFSTITLNWDSTEALAESIATVRPNIIMHTASLQSFWDITAKNTVWSRLILEGGYGITLPLQTMLLQQICSAIELTDVKTRLVNACYPDLVNQVMKQSGFTIDVGIGNVAIVAAVIAGELGLRQHSALGLFAHHYHVSQWLKPGSERMAEPRIWINGTEESHLGVRFKECVLPANSSLNAITGITAVPLLLALLGRQDYIGHAPGVHGLCGGYPIAIREGNIQIRWPSHGMEESLISWNESFQPYDGVFLTNDGYIRFSEQIQTQLRKHSKVLADGFAVKELLDVSHHLLQLRERLDSKT